jgi:hypothetical protein
MHSLSETFTLPVIFLMLELSTKISRSLRVLLTMQSNLLAFSCRSILTRKLRLKRVYRPQRIPMNLN